MKSSPGITAFVLSVAKGEGSLAICACAVKGRTTLSAAKMHAPKIGDTVIDILVTYAGRGNINSIADHCFCPLKEHAGRVKLRIKDWGQSKNTVLYFHWY